MFPSWGGNFPENFIVMLNINSKFKVVNEKATGSLNRLDDDAIYTASP